MDLTDHVHSSNDFTKHLQNWSQFTLTVRSINNDVVISFSICNMTENFSLKALVGLSDVISYYWAKSIAWWQTDSLTDRLTDRLTDWQTDRLTDWQTDWQTDRLTDRQTETDRQTDRQTDWHTDRHADRHTDTDRQTDRPTDRHTDGPTERDRQT